MPGSATSANAQQPAELKFGAMPLGSICYVGSLNEVWITGMRTADYIKRTGNDTLEKALTSKQPPWVIMTPAGSTMAPSVRLLFESLRLNFVKYKAAGGQIIQVDVRQSPNMMSDGRADLLCVP